MAKINARSKGASGEREFCDWLWENFQLQRKPQRNLEQVRGGGADVICAPFAFEVKRRESIDFVSWWGQVTRAVKQQDSPEFGLYPVVAYRQNGNKKWDFLVSSQAIGLHGDHGFIHLTERVFILWAKRIIQFYKTQLEYEPLMISNQNYFVAGE